MLSSFLRRNLSDVAVYLGLSIPNMEKVTYTYIVNTIKSTKLLQPTIAKVPYPLYIFVTLSAAKISSFKAIRAGMEKTVEGDEYLEFSDETLESFSVWAFLAEMATFTLTVRTAVRGYRPNEKDLETLRDR